MNRVWKQFFKNLAWPVGIAVYVWGIVFASYYVDSLYKDRGVIVVVVFMVLPGLVFFVCETWRDAKRKVERENEKMIRILKGN